jgi:hypothetical protein
MSPHPLTRTTTEGPLGFPQTDRQAIALDAILKALPKDNAFRYRKTTVARPPSELLAGERADVSWISTEDPDRTGEVVLAKGMNDSQFKHNPIVTMQHAYWLPPVGKSLWRKVVRDGERQGVKAKTLYPARPADWPEGKEWPADIALSLVQADLLRGKSIGFLPTRVHPPRAKELEENGWPQVDLVIDEWLLLEYACTYLPAQQHAIVEAVSKSLPGEFRRLLGVEEGGDLRSGVSAGSGDPRRALLGVEENHEGHKEHKEESNCNCQPIHIGRFTPLEEIEKALCRRIAGLDLRTLTDRAAQEALDRARGRV